MNQSELLAYYENGDWDFRGQCLNSISFSSMNLEGANFKGAFLRNAYFNGSKLKGALFDEALLLNADFSFTDLTKASFVRSNLVFANFNTAKLHGVNFSGANLVGANFSWTRLHKTFFSGADLRQSSPPDPGEDSGDFWAAALAPQIDIVDPKHRALIKRIREGWDWQDFETLDDSTKNWAIATLRSYDFDLGECPIMQQILE